MARTLLCFASALIGIGLSLMGAPDAHGKQRVSVVVTSSPSPSNPGDAVRFTATVTSQQSGQTNQHCPDGVVQFQIGGADFGDPVKVSPLSVCARAGSVASASASITTSFTNAGNYPVVAIYGGDHDFESGISATFTHTVGRPAPIATTTAIHSSGNPTVTGDPVTFTAVVTPAQWGFGVPTGTVTFTAGNVTLFIGTLNSGSWTEFTTSALPQGANSVTATYSGDGIFGASTGTAIQNMVARSKTATTVSLAASPTSVIVGEGVWLTATVTPAEWVAGTPTGTVTFRSGSLTITGTLSADGWVTVSTLALPLGANSITATYSGDANYSASSAMVTELVNAPGTIPTRVELVASPPASVAGEPVWVTATVTPADWAFGDPTGIVTILLTDSLGNRSTLFSGALPPAGWVEFTTISLPQGPNSLTATYSGDSHYQASISAPAIGQVNPAAGKIPTSVALVASPSSTTVGEPVWLTATVTPQQWTFGNPTGTVTFTSGNVTITGTLSAGQSADWVTVVTSALQQGTHTITATYSGDGRYASSAATVIATVTSLGIETSLMLVTAPNPSVFGEPVTITATVVPGLWGYGAPSGNLTVTSGGLTLNGTLTDGWVTFLTSALPQGNNTITATYGGNSAFKASSAAVVQAVSAPSP